MKKAGKQKKFLEGWVKQLGFSSGLVASEVSGEVEACGSPEGC